MKQHEITRKTKLGDLLGGMLSVVAMCSGVYVRRKCVDVYGIVQQFNTVYPLPFSVFTIYTRTAVAVHSVAADHMVPSEQS